MTGIDYSADMEKLSKKTCKKNIGTGTVEILNADIAALLFENDHFDLITAFDTINFRPDHQKAILWIIRTMKPNGTFVIINACPKEGTI